MFNDPSIELPDSHVYIDIRYISKTHELWFQVNGYDAQKHI